MTEDTEQRLFLSPEAAEAFRAKAQVVQEAQIAANARMRRHRPDMPTREMIDALFEFSPLDRVRLLTRYWTWDTKGFHKALLGSTSLSRVVMREGLRPGGRRAHSR